MGGLVYTAGLPFCPTPSISFRYGDLNDIGKSEKITEYALWDHSLFSLWYLFPSGLVVGKCIPWGQCFLQHWSLPYC